MVNFRARRSTGDAVSPCARLVHREIIRLKSPQVQFHTHNKCGKAAESAFEAIQEPG